MAFFSPLGALSAGLGGFMEGKRQAAEDEETAAQRRGNELFGQAMQGWGIGGLSGMGQQGPQAPPPGQPSMSAQPAVQPPGPQVASAGPPQPFSGGGGGPGGGGMGLNPATAAGAPYGGAVQPQQIADALARMRQGQGQPMGGFQPQAAVAQAQQQAQAPQQPQQPPMPPQARAPMPQPPQPPQQPPPQQPPQFDQQGRPTFDLPTLIARINAVNPKASPKDFAYALKAGLPLLNEEGKVQAAQFRQYMAEQNLGIKDAMLQLRAMVEERTSRQGDTRLDQGQQRIDLSRERENRIAKQADVNASASDEVVDLVGQNKMAPPSGYALRTKWGQSFMEKLAQKYPDYDATAFAANKAAALAEPRALANTLTQLEKSKAAINSFEKTAIQNGKVLTDLADKVDSTGIPVIERWIRSGRQATGDPDVAKFHTQMQVYRTEVAKIINNPNLSGVLTDSARRETEGFLGPGASAKQIKAVVQLLEQDFGRRSSSIDDEIGLVRDNLKRVRTGGGGSASSAPQQQQPVTSGGWSIQRVQ